MPTVTVLLAPTARTLSRQPTTFQLVRPNKGLATKENASTFNLTVLTKRLFFDLNAVEKPYFGLLKHDVSVPFLHISLLVYKFIYIVEE